MSFMKNLNILRLQIANLETQYEGSQGSPLPSGNIFSVGDQVELVLADGVDLLLSVAVDGKPYPVDNLVGVFDTDHVDLTFSAARGTVTGQRIYRSVDDGDFVALTPDIGAEDTSYEDTDVSAGHSYAYYVVGVNVNGESLPSITVTVWYPEPE